MLAGEPRSNRLQSGIWETEFELEFEFDWGNEKD
jgi:hypothetical protein